MSAGDYVCTRMRVHACMGEGEREGGGERRAGCNHLLPCPSVSNGALSCTYSCIKWEAFSEKTDSLSQNADVGLTMA
jgi:hypothetical protein